MNTFMWHQQITHDALAELKRKGAHVVNPVDKTLACGVKGAGALADPAAIVQAVAELFERNWEARQAALARGLPTLSRTHSSSHSGDGARDAPR
mmetsp:Transcript_3748/g.9414  ORF Transcript_3748/g.9414 Transcript_3748/m.9414 type:complete len:94 (+) Transcript_3748:278-559(+)